jgi:serine/threonine-protein kinase
VVAIKLLRLDLARDPIFQARFRREAQSAAGLNHPAIVAVYDTGEETIVESGGGTVSLPYIVMEYVEGRTLREVLRESSPFEVGTALEVTGGVLSALDYSHRMGIVHRDIKPANVMLTATGDIKVMDFGIARALADVSATMTQTQAVIGTAQYLSPEQARGETVDARSDLYSAGCLLYELITGRPPFVADSPVAVAYQHVREQPHPPSVFNPAIPEVVDRVVLHALAKDREARYQTANDFKADLEAARSGRAVAAGTMAMAGPSTLPAPQLGAETASTEYLNPQQPTRTQAYGQLGQTMPGGPGQLPPYNQDPGQGFDPSQDAGYGRRSRQRRGSGNGRQVGFVLLALAVLVLFAGAAWAVKSLVAANSVANATVAIPRVVGDKQAAAEAKLKAAHFAVVIAQEASDKIASGSATRTDPAADTPFQQGKTVKLYISTGSATSQVPDVKGMTQQVATEALKAAGFTVGSVLTEDGGGLKQGLVTRSDPAYPKAASRGQQIAIYLSSGVIKVPDVVGKTLTEAKTLLNTAGITSINIVLTPVADSAPDTVLSQDIKAGQIDAPRPITLYVATQPTTQTTDPNSPGGGGTGQPTDPNQATNTAQPVSPSP